MKRINILLLLLSIITGFAIPQEKFNQDNRMIITPDGKILSRVDGSISPINISNHIKRNKPEIDAPIGTPFSWDNSLGFYAGFSDWTVRAIAVSGSDVFIGGDFIDAMADGNADHILRYNQKNNTWHSLGSGLNGTVHAIAVSGNDVYVGGEFTDAGGNPNADYIARWDGNSWNSLGTGLNDFVFAIAINGNDVYVGGSFTGAGGNFESDYIARWDGSNWNSMGQLDGYVFALCTYGSSLFVGGYFSSSSSANSNYFSIYDGFIWSGLGTPLNNVVYAIAISGNDLYIGGAFSNAGGDTLADAIAHFDFDTYSDWQSLGNGIIKYDYYPNSVVTSLAVTGEDLYVGGEFWSPYNSYFNFIAYWNGTSWDSLNTGLMSSCYAIALSGTDLFVGAYYGLQRWFGAYAEGVYAGLQKSIPAGPGLTEFNSNEDSTVISLELFENYANGIYNVFCYESTPAGGSFLNIAKHRWIIQATGIYPYYNYINLIRIKFSDLADSSGVINPYNVKIFYRTTPGRGQFTELYTQYDYNTNELWAYINSYGEFAIGIPNTIDGLINPNEYGSHVEGANMQTSDGKTWYMRTDDYYMYFGITNYTNTNDAINIYLDNSGIAPANYPGSSYGTQIGIENDNFLPVLPFGAEYYAYIKPGYDEFRQTDQSGGWLPDTVSNTFLKSLNTIENVFEFAIPLSSIPVSTNQFNYPLQYFNWLGYISNSGVISSPVPEETNPNTSGLPEELVWYYYSSTFSYSFDFNCYTHIGSSIPNFGAIDCYDFNYYTPGATITRTSGEWNIFGSMYVWGGNLNFQSNDSLNIGSFLIAGGITNFSYGIYDAPLSIKYFFWQSPLGGTIFMDTGHQLAFTIPQYGGGADIQSNALFQNVTIRNNDRLALRSDLHINESLTILNSYIQTITFDTFYVILNPGALLNGNGYVDGALSMYIQNPPGPNGGDSPDNLIVNFPVGTANGPSPVSIDFSSVNTGGYVTVQAVQSVHPNTFNSSETLGRYWRITKDEGLAFSSADITFNYRPEDFNGNTFSEATDEATMVVGKYDASWSYPSIFSRAPGGINDGGSITISGVTSFSDFTMFKAQLSANIKVFLEGPYSAGSMSTALNTGGIIPLSQPYYVVPWGYNGTETVANIPAGVVDWVLLELRSNTTTQVTRRAAFLKSDGSLVDLNGTSNVTFPGVSPGNYYLVIYHRNHIPIMTANPVEVSNNPVPYDLSTGSAQAYGTNALKNLGGGVYGIYNSDTDGDGTVNATDRSSTWNQRNLSGYYGADVDLSGTVNAADRSAAWNNRNTSTQVPTLVGKPVIEIVNENNN